MDLIVLFLKEDILPEEKSKANKYGGKPLGSSYSRTRNCTNDISRGHTYYAYILKYQNYFLKNYMKEFGEAIQEGDP